MGLYPRNARIANWLRGDGSTGAPAVRLCQIAKYHEHPVLGSSITIHSTLTCGEAIVTVTTGFTQPDVPRNLISTGNAGANEVIRVNGLDAGGDAIYEDFTLNGATPVVGAKAFKTVTSIVTPIGTHTVAIICGDVLGLGHKLANVLSIISKGFNGATDAGTITYSTSVLASNTFAPAGTLDGTKSVEVRYFVEPSA